jgi:hypothetical protein
LKGAYLTLYLTLRYRGTDLEVAVDGRAVTVLAGGETVARGSMENGRFNAIRDVRPPLDPKDWLWIYRVDLEIREAALKALWP